MKYIKQLSSLKILSACLLWLMILLTIGTIEQKNIGLFAAQEKYFFSLYFKYYFIYLPGGGLTISLFTISLISQMLFKTKYKISKKLGITLTHFGALVLMIGSFITYMYGIEGSLILREGESKDYFSDYKNYSLLIKSKDKEIEFKIEDKTFKASKIKLIELYKNCEFESNSNPLPREKGFARITKFKTSTNKETKLSCAEISYNDNIYRIFVDMPVLQHVEDNSDTTIQLINTNIKLPFEVKLIDFDKKFYQGTMLSKSFKSYVQIIDKNITTEHLIEMNHPLRYKGYTFYQSSFSENSEGETSELAVVKNDASKLPYISTLIILIGLIIHLFLNFRKYFHD